MRVDGVSYRTIWVAEDGWSVNVIDQTELPFNFAIRRLTTLDEVTHAIRTMMVRGAPLIGVAAAYGIALALRQDPSDAALALAHEALRATRPTAVNLTWALERMRHTVKARPLAERAALAYQTAALLCDEDVEINEALGKHGLALISKLWKAHHESGRVNILTHCNAGWLATVDWGTALAPVYMAHDAGIPVHVWVDETRPRNQGASLTAWELGKHGVSHTLIVDNAGGHLLQRGHVDLCLVGTDRTTARGDVANKIGTYLKALAARDSGVPFYVCAPSPSIDWTIDDGVKEIPIEERDPREVLEVSGRSTTGEIATVRLAPPETPAQNIAFDVTPARLITAIITERGISDASANGLRRLFGREPAEAKGTGS